MLNLDFTDKGRRPTPAMIVSAWSKAGAPLKFSVSYGETYAEFECAPGRPPRWYDSGNGCRGVQRDKVVAALAAYHERQARKFSDLWR